MIRPKLLNLDFDSEPTFALFKESKAQKMLQEDKLLANSVNTDQPNKKIFSNTQLLLDQN